MHVTFGFCSFLQSFVFVFSVIHHQQRNSGFEQWSRHANTSARRAKHRNAIDNSFLIIGTEWWGEGGTRRGPGKFKSSQHHCAVNGAIPSFFSIRIGSAMEAYFRIFKLENGERGKPIYRKMGTNGKKEWGGSFMSVVIRSKLFVECIIVLFELISI